MKNGEIIGQVERLRVYRFYQTVAVNLDFLGEDGNVKGQTIYLTKHKAFELAKALNAFGQDIRECNFSKSTLPTVEI